MCYSGKNFVISSLINILLEGRKRKVFKTLENSLYFVKIAINLYVVIY